MNSLITADSVYAGAVRATFADSLSGTYRSGARGARRALRGVLMRTADTLIRSPNVEVWASIVDAPDGVPRLTELAGWIALSSVEGPSRNIPVLHYAFTRTERRRHGVFRNLIEHSGAWNNLLHEDGAVVSFPTRAWESVAGTLDIQWVQTPLWMMKKIGI